MRSVPGPLSSPPLISHVTAIVLALILSTGCTRATAPSAPANMDGNRSPVSAGNTLSSRPLQVMSGSVALSATMTGTKGEVVVLIHGGPGLSHHYMRPLASLARKGVRVVLYDQRGVGASQKVPAKEHTLTAHVADLEAVRKATGASKIHLLGHSWGGLVAMAYAGTHPSRAASLMLIDSIPADATTWMAANRLFALKMRALVKKGIITLPLPEPKGADCSPGLIALLPTYYHNPKNPHVKDLGGSSCHTGIRQSTWANIGSYDMRPLLANLTLRTLIVHGESDPFGILTPASLRLALANTRPTVEILKKCGHLPWEECPTQLTAVLERFLSAATSHHTTP